MSSTKLQFGTNISKDVNLRKIDGVDDNLQDDFKITFQADEIFHGDGVSRQFRKFV